jgi:hypothetical protein
MFSIIGFTKANEGVNQEVIEAFISLAEDLGELEN